MRRARGGGARPRLRDTDADWRAIAEREPYWGVLTNPEHRRDQLTPEALERFYASGRDDVLRLAALVERASGRAVEGGRALDFGCGVGRLSEAMRELADEVTGVDVAAPMLELARARSGRVAYRHDLPDGAFDWVNSYIVLQHIPPERGFAYLAALLERLAPGGALTVQLPFAWAPETPFHPPTAAATAPPGSVVVYTYDLNRVFELLWSRGVRRPLLEPTDHGGVWGFIVAGRREED